MKLIKNTVIALSLFFGLFATVKAEANLVVSPSFYSFGSVKSGQTASMSFAVQNLSQQEIRFLNVNYSGDWSVFQFNDSCFYLMPYGTCFIHVTFVPRFSDGLNHTLNIQINSPQGFAFAQAIGVDAK